MKKNALLFILSFLVTMSIFAQNPICKTADDSVLVRKNRGEISYYYPAKYLQGVYFYITFTNNIYIKKQLPLGTVTNDFLTCYNKNSQKLLDSVFKVDFFRKADSILTEYDRSGRGYRNTDFPGGAPALQKYLSKNISLPKDAKPTDTDKSIKVYYSFVVDEKGAISEIKKVKSNCPSCEEEILNVVKKLPNFVPATEAGVAKKVRYILPFTKKI
jgi:hypothetical protein